jgi:hypothetical protein
VVIGIPVFFAIFCSESLLFCRSMESISKSFSSVSPMGITNNGVFAPNS